MINWLRGMAVVVACMGLGGVVLVKDEAAAAAAALRATAEVEGELEFGSRVMFLCSSMLRRNKE